MWRFERRSIQNLNEPNKTRTYTLDVAMKSLFSNLHQGKFPSFCFYQASFCPTRGRTCQVYRVLCTSLKKKGKKKALVFIDFVSDLGAVLCGQLLCFFKDQQDFLESKGAAPPLSLYQAHCERASDYTKRKNVFRLRTSDGAEFLFGAEDLHHLDEWVKKIAFHAGLAPSQQLLSYDAYQVTPNPFGTPFFCFVSFSYGFSTSLLWWSLVFFPNGFCLRVCVCVWN